MLIVFCCRHFNYNIKKRQRKRGRGYRAVLAKISPYLLKDNRVKRKFIKMIVICIWWTKVGIVHYYFLESVKTITF